MGLTWEWEPRAEPHLGAEGGAVARGHGSIGEGPVALDGKAAVAGVLEKQVGCPVGGLVVERQVGHQTLAVWSKYGQNMVKILLKEVGRGQLV